MCSCPSVGLLAPMRPTAWTCQFGTVQNGSCFGTKYGTMISFKRLTVLFLACLTTIVLGYASCSPDDFVLFSATQINEVQPKEFLLLALRRKETLTNQCSTTLKPYLPTETRESIGLFVWIIGELIL